MIAEPIEQTNLIDTIESYGVLHYLGKTGRGFAIQQRPEELSEFITFCQQHNVKTVLELGSAEGGLAYFMADALGWQVTSVDIVPPKHRHESVEFIQMTTDAAYQFLQGRAFDLVFIDADHAFESVKSDHERYAHLGKIVAFHDINSGRDCCEGVNQYWNKLVGTARGMWTPYSDGKIFRYCWSSSIWQYTEVWALGGQDAPGIGWYLNDKFNPGLTRWELYSEPLPDATPDICVVSGTCDRLPYLRKMIESARASVPRGITLRFVIVDGGSQDGTLDYLRQQPDVTLIEHGEKRGIAAAYRDGFDAADGKYVVPANDDVEFYGDAFFKALCYLETRKEAGAVTFYFRNPQNRNWHVNVQGAIKDGRKVDIPYIQMGMVRKELGDLAGWWGGHDPEFPAVNYGLDNYLTSRLWEMGYEIHALQECRFEDYVPNDDLRQRNGFDALHKNEHPDSAIWRKRFGGDGHPLWRATPVPPQPTEHLRILYMPILAGRTEFERDQMRGLYDSLCKVGIVAVYDYWGAARTKRDVGSELIALIKAFKPHILLSQIQETSIITPQIYQKARGAHPSMVAVNWNGDESRFMWNDRPLVDIMRAADLQLVVNPALFPGAVERGINMALMLDSFQPVEPIEGMPEFDVVFLGTEYPPRHAQHTHPRREMIEAIRQRLPHVKLGVYGNNWNGIAVEENTYDYGRNHGAYAAAKIAIVDNMYPDAWGYVSDRFYNALAYAQCCLVKEVEGAYTLFGSPHHVAFWWDDYDKLCEQIETLLRNTPMREGKGYDARHFMRRYHTFDARVRELLDHEYGLIAALVKKK